MSEPQNPLPTPARINECMSISARITGLEVHETDALHTLDKIGKAYVTGQLVRPDIPAPAVSTPIGADPGPLPTSGEINTALNDVQSILIRPGTERVAMMHLTQLGHAYVQNEVTSTKGVAKALHAARTEVEDAGQAAANAKAALADIAKAKSRLAKKLTKVTLQRDEARQKMSSASGTVEPYQVHGDFSYLFVNPKQEGKTTMYQDWLRRHGVVEVDGDYTAKLTADEVKAFSQREPKEVDMEAEVEIPAEPKRIPTIREAEFALRNAERERRPEFAKAADERTFLAIARAYVDGQLVYVDRPEVWGYTPSVTLTRRCIELVESEMVKNAEKTRPWTLLASISQAYADGKLLVPAEMTIDDALKEAMATPVIEAGAALPIVVKVSDEHANAFSKLSAEQRKEVMGKLRSGTHGGIIFLPEEMDGPTPDFDSPAFVDALMDAMKVPNTITEASYDASDIKPIRFIEGKWPARSEAPEGGTAYVGGPAPDEATSELDGTDWRAVALGLQASLNALIRGES